ncbi:hypothetical protein ACTXG5_27270 [Mycobacterium sp. Dal123C01]|uniref:hypothetical protein n=1 Tax=Mycobacterium sp. Dal123C01 TaxID=3457577 RepID=UPI00403E6C46
MGGTTPDQGGSESQLKPPGVAAESADSLVLVEEIVRMLAENAPPDSSGLHAVFSIAGNEEIVDVVADTPDGVAWVPVEIGAVERARAHRELTMDERGPWLRLLLDVDRNGRLQLGLDYGDVAIPQGHQLSGKAYLADLEQYPRADIALWLMAYIVDEGLQLRTAAQAAADAANRVTAATVPRQADDEVPPLPALWSRLAALAAVCRGSDAPGGARTDGAYCVYRSDSGASTLARLPDGRAVLSGGADDSVLLKAAYRGAIEFPQLYRGAPRWIHNLYLDERAWSGLLSFCYWWDGHHWYRAEITERPQPWSAADEIVPAMPDVWTDNSTADLIVDVLTAAGMAERSEVASAAGEFVHAAEARISSLSYLDRLLPHRTRAEFDIAEALAQLDSAGVLLPAHVPIDAEAAKQTVAEYCRANAINSPDHPISRLVATRMDAGWRVSIPVAEGETASGETVFLVADDRVTEAEPSGPPGEAAFAFAARYASRLRGALASDDLD